MRVIGHIPRLHAVYAGRTRLVHEGYRPHPAIVEMRPAQLPPGRKLEHDYFFGIYWHDETIGCADLLSGYRE